MRKKMLALTVLTAMLASLFVGSKPAGAITGGQPDGNNHPYVGLIVFDVEGEPSWRCSGTLLSPTVVLTAGHCTDGADAARIWFDADVTSANNPEYPFGGETSYEGTPYTYEDFCIGCGNGLPGFATYDVGIVVLSEPVPTSEVGTYGQLPSPYYVDTLSRGTSVDLIGYGVQFQTRGGGPPEWRGPRIRMYAPTTLVTGNFTHSDMFIRLTANAARGGGGTCFGDSGGPDLLGGTNIILAVNSYVTNSNCAGVTYSQRIDRPEILAWINSFLD